MERDTRTSVVPAPGSSPEPARAAPRARWFFATAVVLGLLLLPVLGGAAYALATVAIGAITFLLLRLRRDPTARVRSAGDGRDLLAIAITFAAVVVSFRIAFTVVDHDMVLFVFFAIGLLAGVAIPVGYTVWLRGRSLRSLGLSGSDLPSTAVLAVVFAAVQFSITFLGYEMPTASDWVPLLRMALTVGIFESIFFRGFVQGRLEEAFGTMPGVLGAAILYGAYHVGYGMSPRETIFLTGLGVVYAMAYATTHDVLVVWPLLTPAGSLFAQIDGGELLGRLPWAALLGFADVAALFALILWRAHRRERRLSVPTTPARSRGGA